MAAVFKQSASVKEVVAGATTTKAYTTQNCTSGSLLVATAYWQSGTATCSLSDSTNGAWTAVGSPQVGTGANAGWSKQDFYFSGNASVAKPTVTMTVSASVGERGLAIHEYTGVGVLESQGFQNVTANSSAATPSKTPAASTDLVYCSCITSSHVTAVSTGFTEREDVNFGGNSTADDVSPTGGTPIACTFTVAGGDSITSIAVFAASGTTNTVSPSGAATLSGSDVISITTPAGSGTITLAGTKTSSWSTRRALAGGLTLSGSVTALLKKTISPSGTIQFGGGSSATLTPGGGTSINIGVVQGTIFFSGALNLIFEEHGWGPVTPNEPVARVERQAAGAGPGLDVLKPDDSYIPWGGRTATEPQSRTASRAAGGEATAITEPDEDLVWAWRKKYDQTP